MNFKNILCVLIVTIFCSIELFAQKDTAQTEIPWYKWDHIKVQFAGNLGLISLSGGHTFGNSLQTNLFYSYIPSAVYGRHLHTAAIKITYTPFSNFFRNKKVSPIVGTAVSFSFSHKILKNDLPHYFPSGYYGNQWIHVNPFIGAKYNYETTNLKRIKNIELYAEVGSVDMYIWYYVTSNHVQLYQILNLALGVSIYFKPTDKK